MCHRCTLPQNWLLLCGSRAITTRVAAALDANIPPSTRTAMAVVVNVTAEVVADAVEAPRNAGAPASVVLQELAGW
jgi:hypothetical protein